MGRGGAHIGLAIAAATTALGCAAPYLARDGTLVFPEDGARGAAVLTANGVEFHDRSFIPPRVVRRDPHEPWSAPLGFILPKSGRFTETSQATVLTTPGLAVVLRPSDTRVPSWGGEVLVRVEVIAPASDEEARPPDRIALVIDPASPADATRELALAALDTMGAHDKIAVVDLSGRALLRPVPGRYRTLAAAAIEKRFGEPTSAPVDPARAMEVAHALLTGLGPMGAERVVVLSDGAGGAWAAPHVADRVAALAGAGARTSFIAPGEHPDASRLGELAMAGAGTVGTSPSFEGRIEAVHAAVPASGPVRFENVVVGFSGSPSPVTVLEASSGDVRWRLDAGEVELGDISAGEARAEVLRVSVPAWVPGERFELHAVARFRDVGRGGEAREIGTDVMAEYDDDIERIAESRSGDVIAFASALATLKRLDRAFVGPGVDRVGGLRALATMHARSMALLARDTRDQAIREQAEVLRSLLASTGP